MTKATDMVVRWVAVLQIKIDYSAERIFSHLEGCVSRPSESLEAVDRGGRPRPLSACGKSDNDGSSFTGIAALAWRFSLPGSLPTGPCTSLRDLLPRDADLRRVTAADGAALPLTCRIGAAVASGHESWGLVLLSSSTCSAT